MSSDFAIKVEGLSKCYQIYDRPQDRLKQMLVRGRKQYYRDFWALKDVSFEIKKGETVGIIGRNGSGKSTLLQMICGTLNPTSGSVQTNGRIAALLELGSGFNPEFTGRENVYMNAALLGLTKDEINQRFDAIAAFADIGVFIEQPVKTYSSGMYVRLAFAVIAHVSADILVVDEALSVGDAVFTQKCMRFIRSFQEHGSLVFVSHDIASVQNLCQSAIWMAQGQVRQTGFSKNVTEAYLQDTLQQVYGESVALQANPIESVPFTAELQAIGADHQGNTSGSEHSFVDNVSAASGWRSGVAEVIAVSIQKTEGRVQGFYEGGEKVCLRIYARADQDLASPILGFLVRDKLGQDLFGENTLSISATKPCSVLAGQKFGAEFIFTLPMLPNGQYAVVASVADGDLYNNVQHHFLHDALIINVTSSKIRWGLVGITFEHISLQVSNDSKNT
jgi:lipopolysaccharide transport system ATP-binding protein